MRSVLTVALLLAASPALAQHFEIAPLVSVTTPAAIERKAAGIQDLTIDSSVSWGSQVAWFFATHLGVEALWTYQSTGISLSAGSNGAEIMELTTEQVDGTIVYAFGAAGRTVRPFVFGGLGATVFRSPGLANETKASWTAGAGLKWFPQQRFGLEMRARYKPIDVD